MRQTIKTNRESTRLLLLIALLMPLFFQLSSGIFRDPSFTFDSGGKLLELPLPLSIVACYLGVASFSTFKYTYISLLTIFSTCLLMLLSIAYVWKFHPASLQPKILTFVQYVLPMFALSLGQMFSSGKVTGLSKIVGKAFLLVLVLVVPIQLISTWGYELPYLVPSIGGLFSIYQHLQYVPVIFVSAYLLVIYSLWDEPNYKKIVIIFSPIMAVYAVASLSMAAIGLFLIGFFILSTYRLILKKDFFSVIFFVFLTVLSCSYFQYANNFDAVTEKYGFINESSSKEQSSSVPNVSQRIFYWKYYSNGVFSSSKTMIFGHDSRLKRTEYPSAHNYYLDFAYNFGLIALVPILCLLVYTIFLVVKNRKGIFESDWLIGLCMVVFFLLIVDNSLKVGLKQPYSGTFTFFLWGLLLSILRKENMKGSQ